MFHGLNTEGEIRNLRRRWIIPWAPTWDGGYLHYLSIRVYGDYLDYEVRKVFPPSGIPDLLYVERPVLLLRTSYSSRCAYSVTTYLKISSTHLRFP